MIIKTGFTNPLQQDYSRFRTLASPCYLSSIWEFASTYKITIMVQEPTELPWEHNGTIKEVISQMLTKENLYLFNMCRIYLQVMWISEIVSADGLYIDWYAHRGLLNPTRRSKWKWPNQGVPPSHAWRIWDAGLNLLGTKERSGKIRVTTTLGKWKLTTGTGWAFNANSNRLLNLSGEKTYSIQPGRPTHGAVKWFTEYRGNLSTFTVTHVATVIQKERQTGIELEAIGECVVEVTPTVNTFQDFVQLGGQIR
jgi:hypothetical protein